MSELCGWCRVPGVNGVCPDCGARCAADEAAEAIDPDIVVFRQCPFRTGAWRCRLHRQAKAKEAWCDVHRQGLRDAVRDLSGMLAIMLEQRAAVQASRRPEEELPLAQQKAWRLAQWVDGLTPEQAFDRLGCRPFHWRPIEECWHLLTGQETLPTGSERLIEEACR
ncbi:MAG: hypothetical protein AB7T38_02580 [Nitrospirales bacterium]